MKKTIKFSALLEKNNQTLFILKNGDVYSVHKNTGEYMTNVYDDAVFKNRVFNCREKQLILRKEIRRLINSGYSPVNSFTSETLSVFRSAKKMHEKDARFLRDTIEFGLNFNE